MAQVDTSMYNTAPQANPLQMLGGMVGAANGIQQNKLLQQQVQGNQGVTDLWSNYKDENGNPDYNAIMQAAGKAGIYAPKVIQDVYNQQMQKAQLGQALSKETDDRLATAQNLHSTMVNNTSTLIPDFQAALEGKGPFVTKGQYDPDKARAALLQSAADAVNASTGTDGKPILPPAMAAMSISGGVDKNGNTVPGVPVHDPALMIQSLTTRQAQSQAMLQHLETARNLKAGIPGTAEINGMTQPTMQGFYNNNITPAPGAQPVPTGTSFDASGKPVYNSDLVKPGNGMSSAGTAGKNAIPGSPGTAVQGASPASNAGPFAGVQAAQSTPTIAAHSPALPPAYAENLQSGLGRVNDAVKLANDSQGIIAPLQGVIKLADSGGPTKDLQNQLRGALAENPVLKGLDLTPDSDPAANFQILQKYANEVTGQNMSANAKNQIESAVQNLANPSATQFPKALRTIASYLLGRTNAAVAKGNYYSQQVLQNPNPTPQGIATAEQNWRQNFDQEAYQLPYMTADERQNLIQSMAPQQQAAFKKKIHFASQNSLISHEDLQ